MNHGPAGDTPQGSVNNRIRGRFNAWLFEALDDYMHARLGPAKTRLFAGVPGTVVEIGPGSGANLRYLPRGTHVIAIAPNIQMHERLRRRAAHLGLDLELRSIAGESLDIDSASVSFVFTSLVLCSVTSPARVVAEARRVLAHGGRFVCLEHVRADGVVGALQHLVRRPWRWVFEGCELLNETESVLRAAGFADVTIEHLVIPTAFLPIRYQIAVVCTA